MGEINLLTKYPKSNRPIEKRHKLVDENIRKIARKFDFEYFDGDRNYGYGGYYYNSKYWTETTKLFYKHYKMHDNFSILDIGCAKGYMLFDFLKINNKLKVTGLEISDYAIKNAKPEIRHLIDKGNAINLPYPDNSFDLIISINTLHNLEINDFTKSLKEIHRVKKKYSYITVDAWTNNETKKRMLKWNLTALTYMHINDWKKLFKDEGYDGDYYWFLP